MLGLRECFEPVIGISNEEDVSILKSKDWVGDIPLNLYNLLLVINGKTYDQAISNISKITKTSFDRAKYIYDNLIRAYQFILTDKTESIKKDLPFFGTNRKKINV